jgi:hypothetical protein
MALSNERSCHLLKFLSRFGIVDVLNIAVSFWDRKGQGIHIPCPIVHCPSSLDRWFRYSTVNILGGVLLPGRSKVSKSRFWHETRHLFPICLLDLDCGLSVNLLFMTKWSRLDTFARIWGDTEELIKPGFDGHYRTYQDVQWYWLWIIRLLFNPVWVWVQVVHWDFGFLSEFEVQASDSSQTPDLCPLGFATPAHRWVPVSRGDVHGLLPFKWCFQFIYIVLLGLPQVTTHRTWILMLPYALLKTRWS